MALMEQFMIPEIETLRRVIRAGLLNDFCAQIGERERDGVLPYIDVAKSQMSHLEFMRFCWGRKREMLIGLHTWLICKQIDIAFENFRNGISTFLINLVCFRQGKSEVTTRFLPPHFLAEFPDREVIVTSHSTKNTNKFSRFGRTLIRSNKFKQLYPDIDISKENAGVEEWGIEDNEGLAQYFGILAGASGTGGGLIVTDDYFGGREDAESELMRDKIDEAYTDNIFTRRDDPSINMITVTPWHPDDLVGRIQKRMKSESQTTRYNIIRMPYKDPDENTIEVIKTALAQETDEQLHAEMTAELERYANGGYLFSKKYSDQWYIDMETSLGGPTGYGTISLMRCNPKSRTGGRFNTGNAKYLSAAEFKEKTRGLTFVRAWDLASSVKQVVKSDPDYTVGVKLAVRWLPAKIKGLHLAEVFIADVVRGRWEATRRNKRIIETAINDGLIKIGIEAYGQYKDAYTELKSILQGIRIVKKMRLPGDKHVKSSVFEPIFDIGNFYMLQAPWNTKYIEEFEEDGGSHDDQIDASAVAVGMNKPVEIGWQYEEAIIL